MPFDGLVLYKLIKEMREKLIGKTIRNIYQPISEQIYIKTNMKSVMFNLKNPSYVLLLEDKPEIPQNPYNFSMFLRKKIKNGKIIDIQQIELDRLGFFEIKVINNVGNLEYYKLYFELMGRFSNLILVNAENKIEDVFNKSNSENRTLFPGAEYKPFFDDKQVNLLKNFSIDSVSNLMGFSKQSKRFFNYLGLEKTLQCLNNDVLYFYEEYDKVDISAIEPAELDYQTFSPSETLIHLFNKRAYKSRYIQIKKELEKKLFKDIEKKERTKINLIKDIEDSKRLPHIKRKGELLQSYLYKVKKGDEEITINDWETNIDIKIVLDPLKNPSDNLNNYFKRAKKLEVKNIIAKKRLKKIEHYLEYLYQLWIILDNSDDVNDLYEIKEEMIEQNIIKLNKNINKKTKISKINYREYEYKDFKILNAKNNKQNDELNKNAVKEDIWLHTQNIPSSHTIIKSAGREVVPLEVIEFAAKITALYSRAKNSSNVPVDYTTRNNVWKPKGAKPGMWLYKNYKTIFVEPMKS